MPHRKYSFRLGLDSVRCWHCPVTINSTITAIATHCSPAASIVWRAFWPVSLYFLCSGECLFFHSMQTVWGVSNCCSLFFLSSTIQIHVVHSANINRSRWPGRTWIGVHCVSGSHCDDEWIGLLVNHILLDADHTRFGQHVRRSRGDGNSFVRRISARAGTTSRMVCAVSIDWHLSVRTADYNIRE